MSESGMRGNVIKVLKPVHGFAVENPTCPGTPDVNYIEGWIELKWLRAWPKRETTDVKLDHYTPQQRLWIKRRHENGGKVFLLLQCKREWLLFKHPATMDVGKVPKAELIKMAYKYWKNGLNKEEFIKCLG